ENIAGGANTIQVTQTISGTLRFAILEYSGVVTSCSLDVAAAAQGNSSSPNSGNAVTTANGDLLLGAIMTSDVETYTAGSGYNIEERVPAVPNTKLIAEDQIQGNSGTTSVSASLGAADLWAGGLAAFKAVSSGSGTAPSITNVNPSSGAVGTSVTITGTNFGATQGTSTVKFNGTAGTPTSWSATSITVAVPSGATTGNIIVTVGGVASNGMTFTVTAVAPVITSSDKAAGTVGTAFSYQITATNSPTNFGASGLPSGLTVNTVSGLISGTPTGAAGTSSVTLSASNSGGTGSAPLTLTISSGGTGSLVSHTIQISSDADDGYYNNENGTGWHSTSEYGGADLVGSWSGLIHAWVTGYRFPSVGANSGDTIQSAYLQLVNSANSATSAICGSEPCSNSSTFRVYGVAQDNGAAFSGAAGNTPLDVPYTVAYTDYTTTGPGDDHGSCQGNNNGQNTCTHVIDVTNIVREITSRPGWTNTSAMRFVMLSTDSTAPNVYAGYEDYSANAGKAATLVVNPPVPTIVSSGAWGTDANVTYPTTYTVGPFLYPGASTLLLFLGDYYNFYSQPIPQPTVSDSCGNTWNILAGPTNWAGISYDMRSTVYYVQNPASCPAGAAITIKVSIQEPIFLHFLAIAGTDT